MQRPWRQLILALVLAVCTTAVGSADVWGLPNQTVRADLDVDGLAYLEAQWTDAMQQRRALAEGMRALEREYQRIVRKIDAIKRGGVDNLERPELQQLLRQGKLLAERLQKLQERMQALDEDIERLSAEIVETLDVERMRLEQRLISATPSERAEIVADLNELNAERARYAKPLPGVDRSGVASILKESSDLEDPDDMLAMADELRDAEAQVRGKLDAIRAQLTELRQRQRLLRRARAFSREERFFEEGDRGRALAARVGSGGGQQEDDAAEDTPVINTGDESPAPPQSGNTNNDTANDDVNNLNGGVSGSGSDRFFEGADPVVVEDDANAPPNAETPDRGGDGFQNGGGEPISDAPGGGVDTPRTPNSDGDAFGTPEDTLVINQQADPNVSTREVELGESAIDDRIDELERDREELEKQATQLKRRADQLREDARTLE